MATVTLFDVIQGWVAENYPRLYVRPFDPVDRVLKEQVRIYLVPDSDSFFDCLVTVYQDPEVKSIFYSMPNGKYGAKAWDHMHADINRPDYFVLLKNAIDLALEHFSPR